MTWILVKAYLKKAWVWLKEHWQIPFLLVWTLVVYLLTRRNTDAIIEVMQAKKDSYKKQLEVLRETHNNEIIKRQELSEKYEAALRRVEKEFEKEDKQLTQKHKEEIKETIIKSKGNTDEIKRRIEEEFNIQFVE